MQATPIGHLAPHRDRAGRPHSPCATIGRDRVDLAPFCPYKYHPKGTQKKETKEREQVKKTEKFETGGNEKENIKKQRGERDYDS
jgi:hypothetical protein